MKSMEKENTSQSFLFENLKAQPFSYGSILLNKDRFIQILEQIIVQSDLTSLKKRIFDISKIIKNQVRDQQGLLNIDPNGDTISLCRDVLISELDQVLDSQTINRAMYYLKRLENSIKKVKTGKINDINLLRWKEYDEIITDSLWILDKRDTSGAHFGWYWGNFIPQIPHQMMLRYIRKGHLVLYTFVSIGMTLVRYKKGKHHGGTIQCFYN